MKTIKKIISLLLCVCFALPTVMLSAYAANPWGPTIFDYDLPTDPGEWHFSDEVIVNDKTPEETETSTERKPVSSSAVGEIFTMDGYYNGDAPLYYVDNFEDLWKNAIRIVFADEKRAKNGFYVKLYKSVNADDESKGFGDHNYNDPNGAFGENGEIVVPEGCNITIDLNGCHFDRFPKSDPATMSGNKRIIKVDGGNLNLISSVKGTFCFVEHGRAGKGGGIYVTNNGTAVIGEMVDIDSCYADEGGGVFVEPGSNLIMTKDSHVDYCKAKRGGGIYNKGDCMLKGAVVSGNHADDDKGGGIYNDADSDNSGKTIIEGSQICSNTAGYEGGGIYALKGHLYIGNGTEIYNNVSENQDSGGVFVRSEATASFYGKVKVQNNIGVIQDERNYDGNVSVDVITSGDSCSGETHTLRTVSILTLDEGSYLGLHPKSNIDIPSEGLEIASKINNKSVSYVHLDKDTMKAMGYNRAVLEKGERTEDYYKINTTGSIIISGNVRIVYIIILFALGLMIGAFAAFLKKKDWFRKGEINV